jgi:O-antigen/teichoic acid export membrane protein
MKFWQKFKRPIILLVKLKKSIKLFFSDKFIAGSSILTVATISSGAFGYAYQIMLGSLMSSANFAIFSAILSLYVFFASPFNVIYMLISRNVATQLDKDKSFLYQYFEQSLFLVALILLIPVTILLYFQELFNRFLGVTEWYIVPLVLIFAWLVALQTVCNAFIQGMQMYKLMALVMIFTVVTKVAASALLLGYLDSDILNGLLGLGISIILMLFFSIKRLARIFCATEKLYFKNINQLLSIQIKQIISFFKNATPILIVSISFVGMTQLDMFFVNHYMSSINASNYAVASVFGKVILYLPGGLALALYPMVANNHSNHKSSILIIKKALILTFASSIILCIIYYYFGEFIISFFYAEKYSFAYLILRWYAMAMVPMALILVMENFLIAKGEFVFSWVFLIIFPLQIIALNLVNDSPWEIITIVGSSGLMVLMIGSLFIIYKYKLLKVWNE